MIRAAILRNSGGPARIAQPAADRSTGSPIASGLSPWKGLDGGLSIIAFSRLRSWGFRHEASNLRARSLSRDRAPTLSHQCESGVESVMRMLSKRSPYDCHTLPSSSTLFRIAPRRAWRRRLPCFSLPPATSSLQGQGPLPGNGKGAAASGEGFGCRAPAPRPTPPRRRVCGPEGRTASGGAAPGVRGFRSLLIRLFSLFGLVVFSSWPTPAPPPRRACGGHETTAAFPRPNMGCGPHFSRLSGPEHNAELCPRPLRSGAVSRATGET